MRTTIGLIYVPGKSYYDDGFWLYKNRKEIEEGSPWAMLEEFDMGRNPEINETFTRSFGSQDAFLSHFFETADEIENEALFTASVQFYDSPTGVVPESGSSRPDIVQALDGDTPGPNMSKWAGYTETSLISI
jgi:hypothetical protein